MSKIHQISFQGSGAVEFARLMKAIRDETGFQTRLLQVEGRFPNPTETLILTIEAPEFEGSTDELRQLISSYVPVKKEDKKKPKE